MLIVGLTGGIGSGKTTAAKMFADLGADIIDTDQLAREVVAPGTIALKKITEHFGKEILDKKQLNRTKLGTIVFQNPAERKWLEQLLHPLIRKKTRERIAASNATYCIVVIPLLVETKPHPLINRVLVVDTPEEQQIQRAKERDRLSKKQINAILQSQVTRSERLAAANDVIYNDQDLAHLKQQVVKLHNYYLTLTKK